MNAKEAARADAQAKLREWIKPGDTVYTILRHVSRSGMSRNIGLVLIKPDERPGRAPITLHPNWLTAQALGLRQPKTGDRDSVTVSGCGMDMGFHVVYELSATLFRGGFGCIGEGCPSNDHSNGDRDYTPHHVNSTGDGQPTAYHWHKDGGYALRQRWL